MNILYTGDIMGEIGIETVENLLPDIIKQNKIDLVIAQSENTTEGKGINIKDMRRLQRAGIDFCTGGNWSLYNKDIWPLLSNPAEPIIRPANMPIDMPGLGYKIIKKNNKLILVISLLGSIIGKDSKKPLENPLLCIDKILENNKSNKLDAIIVNFHGDYSSEKVIIGHYLDGRVSAVIGDHWHIPTADARILPKGTAHITDVGMCGILNSSLGISFRSVVPRWKNNSHLKNELETAGKRQFNAVLIKIKSELSAEHIEQIQQIK